MNRLRFGAFVFSSLFLVGCLSTKTPSYSIVRQEEKLDYIVSKIEYPNFSDNKYTALNKEIKKCSVDTYQEFKNESIRMRKALQMQAVSEYIVSTDEVSAENNIVSVLLETSEFQGGAHPNKLLNSFNFDSYSQKFVKITDITGMSLKEISALARKQLKAKLITGKNLTNDEKLWLEQMIDDGTEPQERNFSTFLCKKNEVIIYFEPYSVAPYVYGTQTVSIQRR